MSDAAINPAARSASVRRDPHRAIGGGDETGQVGGGDPRRLAILSHVASAHFAGKIAAPHYVT